MENTVESNKLIAEFMGGKMKVENYYGINIIEINNQTFDLNGLKYHSSWDWLMPVVDSIYNLGFDEQTTNEIGDITHALVDINIQKTHEAVVEFIKWYNENK